jgi:hypothetical protein
LAFDLQQLRVAIVDVSGSIFAKESLAGREDSASEGLAEDAVVEGDVVAVYSVWGVELREFGEEFWGNDVVGIKGEAPVG